MAPQRGLVAPPPENDPALAIDQVLDERGVADPARVPRLSPNECMRIYRWMLLARTADERLLALQRQGRIGFYAENKGQEAAIFGTAAALQPDDWTVPALRESWVAIFRGLPLRTYVAQIFGNKNDPSLGHQLPCHPGTRASRHITMSSCIASQIPHAVGLAYAAKVQKKAEVVIGYMGDGATSEGDFHVALNFAGVLRAPVVFVCQNNQWAISTPVERQTASPTFAIKALAYGIPGVRVDGNDVLAVYDATRRAVEHARAGGGPAMIECLTYRVSAHSSSDDPSRYRDERITEQWRKKDPIARFRTWLLSQGWLDAPTDERLQTEVDAEIREAIAAEEEAAPPALPTIVEQVFAEVPEHLREQLAELDGMPRQKLGGAHQ